MLARSVSLYPALVVILGGAAFAQTAAEGYFQEPMWEKRDRMVREGSGIRREAAGTQPLGLVPRTAPIAYSTPSTVTLHELQHHVPGKALKEYAKGHKALAGGQLEEALDHFRKASSIDPEFADAHIDAASAYLKLQKPDDAIGHLGAASKIDPYNAVSYSNLTVAYLMKGQLPEAETAARRGMDLDRTGSRLRMLLGLTLMMRKKYTSETVGLLRRSKDEYPQAGLLLGNVLAGRGEYDAAKSELQPYLGNEDSEVRDLAHDWISAIERRHNARATVSSLK